jgi:hypothetical protein
LGDFVRIQPKGNGIIKVACPGLGNYDLDEFTKSVILGCGVRENFGKPRASRKRASACEQE